METRGRTDAALWAVYLVAGVAVTAVYLQLPARAGALLYEAVGLSAVVAVLVGLRLHRVAHAAPWHLLAGGLAALVIGDSIFNANDLVFDNAPFPSVADVAYLSAYPLLCAAVVMLVRRRLPGQDAGSLIDALMLGVGCGVVSWVFLMDPYASDRGLTLLEQVVSIAYPAADVVLLVVVTRLLLSPGARPKAFLLLFGGLLLTLAGDTGFAVETLNGTYGTPDPNDVLFLLSYLCIGAAALHPSVIELDRPQAAAGRASGWRLGLLALAALTPAGFLAVQATRDSMDSAAVIIGGAVLVPLLALVRVGLLLRELAKTAALDPLTSLPNRSMLFERIGDALERARRNGTSVALLYLDLDRFKVVNDLHGHAMGDQLLVAVAERLRTALRFGDTVARVGGDEFVVLCEGLGGQQGALTAADRISLALVEPVTVGHARFVVGTSIGVAVSTGHDAPDVLLNDADAAMYRAKELGRGRAELFDPSMRHPTSAGTTHLDKDLAHAIDRGQLGLYFQPQLTLDRGELIGVEALLRWHHPEWGTLPPATIVPIAEETGLLGAVTAWVVDCACRHAADWARSGTDVEITVNLSAAQLHPADAAGVVLDALARWRVAPDRLCVDVSDAAELVRDAPALRSLAELRAAGVHVAIDDFGTHRDEPAVLRSVPADRLKLDPSLVASVTEGDEQRTIVAAMITLGRDLGMRVVAEGVETRSQRRELTLLGCHDGIGHLWAPALPPGSVLDQVLGRERSPA